MSSSNGLRPGHRRALAPRHRLASNTAVSGRRVERDYIEDGTVRAEINYAVDGLVESMTAVPDDGATDQTPGGE